ncbi:EAL domain-containing protein [Ahrensia sp. R2A130]|uniref:EAL domain-containing protein n=1 Tax=Ahrensia sp. R2A130 TaxID=744979 RepID=UPI0001E0D86E|nr:EAL domain-containing protein [Ahrensia sp. R2A130]EFL88894.1 diguanylate cyclase/phosphodiesterase with PAS/PAC sensor [Ahrensia sp. R2A130]
MIRFILAVLLTCLATTSARALDPVDVTSQATAIDLKGTTDFHPAAGARLAVQTAPDAGGVINRIEVRSTGNEGSGDWLSFALANKSDRQIDRLIVAPHYRLPGSGFMWPDLGRQRIVSITPSQGFALDRQLDGGADIFRVTLDPGAVVTFVAELGSADVPSLTLWEPDAYKDAVNSFTLYEGIVLGISGLLAVFLTILFVVKGSAMFPATAALAWAVLAYICVDFGFISKIVDLAPGDLNRWRAGTEVALAATLLIFPYAYLHLGRWNSRWNWLMLGWIAAMGALFAAAIFMPERASGIARMAFAGAVGVTLLLIIILCFQRYDRAILIVPTWLLTIAWTVGGWWTISGQLDNDIIQPALGGGLVLLVLLLAFTVMQHAFAGGAIAQNLVSDVERQALALTGSGDAVFDWDVDRDRIHAGPEVATALGLKQGALDGAPADWLPHLHPEDRSPFRSALDVILDHRKGRLKLDIRLRGDDAHYTWYALRARPVIGNDGEVLRCVGSLTNVTDQRVAQERLLHDAVHDNLTGLPNKQIFLDRIESAIAIAQQTSDLRPSLFIIDFDRFAQLNKDAGVAAGDAVLLTMARRIRRILRPQDCLARLSNDQFGLLLLSQGEPEKVVVLADALQRAIRAPISFAEEGISVTASVGLVSWSNDRSTVEPLYKDAETAMLQAKRLGGDRIEPFRPAFRHGQAPVGDFNHDLRSALDLNQLEMVYQPIVDLKTRQLVGFEALMRWQHPERGAVMPSEFIPAAEKSGLIVRLGQFALEQAATELARMIATGDENLFVSVNVSSRQLLRHDLINDVKTILARHSLPRDALRLELTESLIMDNPEHATRVLARVRDAGAGLALDDFGTGFSSLSHLMRFPFDTIKIDRAFLDKQAGPERPIILKSIVTMAHDLGMQVIAEGAESERDALELEQMGCEFAQGFHFGPGVSADDAMQLLTRKAA